MTQAYRSQAKIGGSVIPIAPGGSSYRESRNWIVPEIAGNFASINFASGLQTPGIDLQFVLLDAAAATCPVSYEMLAPWFARSNDAAHDIAGLATCGFFDGANGFDVAFLKGGQFTIGSSTGEPVRFSASYAAYHPSGTQPTARTTAFAAFDSFPGKPVTWNDCSFWTGDDLDVPLGGIVSWQLTFSTSLTPDMSQLPDSATHRIPLAMNAGKAVASFQLNFNAAAGTLNHIANGDSFAVQIASNGVGAMLIVPALLIDDDKNRENQAPRVMRPYSGQCLAKSNATGPLYAVALS